jgi:hypothetical protein
MDHATRCTPEVSALIAAFFLAISPFPAPAQTAPPYQAHRNKFMLK